MTMTAGAVCDCRWKEPGTEPVEQKWKPDWKWLDEDHAFYWITRSDGSLFGANICHRKADGHWCEGHAAFSADRSTNHQLICEDPITITPSILCHCGEHGFVRDGKWEGV